MLCEPFLTSRSETGWDIPLLVWRAERPLLAVGSAPLGGGIGVRGWVLNATVPMSYDRDDPAAHLAELADGRQNLIAVMGPSDMVGELSLFDPGPRTATATAVTDTRLVRLRKQALRPWLNNRPEIAEQLLRVLARRLRRTNDSLADLIFTDVPGRVAKNLLQMAGRFGTRDGGVLRVTHDLTQEEIAQLVGASRETVNKALADFASRGWLRLDGKSIIILDPERLARRARV